jgi:hypothetical protein
MFVSLEGLKKLVGRVCCCEINDLKHRLCVWLVALLSTITRDDVSLHSSYNPPFIANDPPDPANIINQVSDEPGLAGSLSLR